MIWTSHACRMLFACVQGYNKVGELPPMCTRASLFAHRYALGKKKYESVKDQQIYHAGVLLEWDHGAFCTVVCVCLCVCAVAAGGAGGGSAHNTLALIHTG